MNGVQGVEGSNPFIPTSTKTRKRPVGAISAGLFYCLAGSPCARRSGKRRAAALEGLHPAESPAKRETCGSGEEESAFTSRETCHERNSCKGHQRRRGPPLCGGLLSAARRCARGAGCAAAGGTLPGGSGYSGPACAECRHCRRRVRAHLSGYGPCGGLCRSGAGCAYCGRQF